MSEGSFSESKILIVGGAGFVGSNLVLKLLERTPREILIVDNHSTDNTDSVVKSFDDPRVQFFRNHNEGVVAVSRNFGLKHAVGEYIAFLDSDDWWHPQKLEVSLKYLERGADVVYHDLFRAKKSNQRIFCC